MDSYKVQDVVPFEGRFPSWEAFDVARKAHCEKTHTLYVCRNTVKVAIANKRRKLQVPDSWVYDRKVYVCTHGYRRISRSSGSRPRQKVRYTNCKARFTASVVCEMINNAEVLCIKITGQHLEHDDHPVSLDQWRNYSQNRASIVEHPYLIHEAELMRRIGSNKRTAREHIETLSGKVCTMKDMHNLYARLKKREDVIKTNSAMIDENPTVRVESVLQQFVDAHVENHVSILSADDGSNEAICLSSKAMKEHFQVFPELCLLDVTICPRFDMDGYQMQGFLSMDALGNSKPVFLAQSSNTSTSLFRRICQDFKRTHPKWTAIKILVMDKLHPEVVDVLHHEFPEAQVLLCQFHAIKFLTSLVTQVEFEIPNVQSQEHVRELMKQMVFANSQQAYNDSKSLLLQHLDSRMDHPLLVHIDQHWEPYRNLWASYWRGIVLEFSAFFTKGMESFWNPLKNAFERTGGSGIHHKTLILHPTSLISSANTTGNATNTTTASFNGSGVGMPTSVNVNTSTSSDDVDASGNGGGYGRNTSITKCISEVLTMVKFIEEEWTSKMMILEMTKPLTEFSSDPLLHFMVNCLSSFAVSLISSQLMALNADTGNPTTSATISVTRGPRPASAMASSSSTLPPGSASNPSPQTSTEPETVVWADKATRKKHVMQRDCSGCDCEFYQLYQLPCQHLIYYELSVLKNKQLSMSAVGQRWFLRTFQYPKIVSQRESNEIEYHIL
uniref:SWIM-type domain-containing protein n=1 Tax=Globisporangium ultimum (strain ATCC 200006 / CBS 805.95 / DAOM BR144) TaxID=431595 RepID=K3WGQ4_GLOUD